MWQCRVNYGKLFASHLLIKSFFEEISTKFSNSVLREILAESFARATMWLYQKTTRIVFLTGNHQLLIESFNRPTKWLIEKIAWQIIESVPCGISMNWLSYLWLRDSIGQLHGWSMIPLCQQQPVWQTICTANWFAGREKISANHVVGRGKTLSCVVSKQAYSQMRMLQCICFEQRVSSTSDLFF